MGNVPGNGQWHSLPQCTRLIDKTRQDKWTGSNGPTRVSNSNYLAPLGKFRKLLQAEQRAEGAFLVRGCGLPVWLEGMAPARPAAISLDDRNFPATDVGVVRCESDRHPS